MSRRGYLAVLSPQETRFRRNSVLSRLYHWCRTQLLAFITRNTACAVCAPSPSPPRHPRNPSIVLYRHRVHCPRHLPLGARPAIETGFLVGRRWARAFRVAAAADRSRGTTLHALCVLPFALPVFFPPSYSTACAPAGEIDIDLEEKNARWVWNARGDPPSSVERPSSGLHALHVLPLLWLRVALVSPSLYTYPPARTSSAPHALAPALLRLPGV
ncbi:hypothetical protein B0H14DRAFT_3462710 [Mycena olivaceomarginata]|nr:hypothetical protein B0H14DRAFT_3462710 [Mycena olivaceomarginata]